jgi:hypothetical protein
LRRGKGIGDAILKVEVCFTPTVIPSEKHVFWLWLWRLAAFILKCFHKKFDSIYLFHKNCQEYQI